MLQKKNKLFSFILGAAYDTALYDAIVSDNIAAAWKLLAEDGYSANMENEVKGIGPYPNRSSLIMPLHLVAQSGTAKMADCLLKHGADANAFSKVDDFLLWTPLQYALFHENFKVASLLIDNYAVKVDENMIAFVKANGLVKAAEFLKPYLHENSVLVEETQEVQNAISTIHWYNQHKPAYKRDINAGTFEDHGLLILERKLLIALLAREIPFVKSFINQPHFTAKRLNAPVFDIERNNIDDRFNQAHPEWVEKLASDSKPIFGGYVIEQTPNTRKVPLLFLVIILREKEIANALIQKGASLEYEVNGIAAKALMKAMFFNGKSTEMETCKAAAREYTL